MRTLTVILIGALSSAAAADVAKPDKMTGSSDPASSADTSQQNDPAAEASQQNAPASGPSKDKPLN